VPWAEKNFNKLAERMEEEGEPIVDQNYFKHAVAKATSGALPIGSSTILN